MTVDVEAVSQEGNKDVRFDPLDHLMVDRAHFQIVACPRTFIQRRLESRLVHMHYLDREPRLFVVFRCLDFVGCRA